MISQADIIKTLVNQNCTDESIMSTALSLDCTLPKLLEKFTEAERFDLALDVSMKLGMDVTPLSKTWALRCLKNRNFQGAREKFKHCFQRLKSSSMGRLNPACCMLLADILKVLTRMEETKLPLNEEIELIKQRRHLDSKERSLEGANNQISSPKISEIKPKIYDECMHYLREYGTIEQQIKFFVVNELWDEAVEKLLLHCDRDNLSKFFIQEVFLYSATVGRLDRIVAAFLKSDPTVDKFSRRYFKAIYDYLDTNKRYNLLYYIQDQIGDHVAAAENQVEKFFLRMPTMNYRELNHRVPSLISAQRNYNQYLEKVGDIPEEQDADGKLEILFTKISKTETESRLKTIATQIEITRNFAISELAGGIHGMEVPGFSCEDSDQRTDPFDKDDASPVTLFDKCPRRRTFLAALVMTYFDPTCSAYFSDRGFDLAKQLVQDFALDKLQVFKTAMRIIIEDESSNILENANLLIKRLQEDYLTCATRSRTSKSSSKSTKKPSPNKATSAAASATDNVIPTRPKELSPPKEPNSKPSSLNSKTSKGSSAGYYFKLPAGSQIMPGTRQAAQLLCDEVIRDSIRSCREPDYKMELSKLLSDEAKIELYIELGKLSIAKRLAFDMNRPDFVTMIMREADKLNQEHVKDVCQHWLAKH